MCNPADACRFSYANSKYISAPLTKLVLDQEDVLDPKELLSEIKYLRLDVDQNNDKWSEANKIAILSNAPPELKFAVQAASEKGASSWVTALPSYDHDTVLHKSDFVDAKYI